MIFSFHKALELSMINDPNSGDRSLCPILMSTAVTMKDKRFNIAVGAVDEIVSLLCRF